ncbi:hypothetical protein [Azospirillum agricola]|uniref:hypothetical protein n=1 Tax=Azospirillum agricola TaxID=1720247 RepID=UPI001178308F|nr:hypothetical protein [Azospirillum agricola]
MTAPLHDCVIRFWRETGTGRTVAGTGFLATGADGKTYALTCAHVANLALGRSLTTRIVCRGFRRRPRSTARVQAPRPLCCEDHAADEQ